MNERIKELAEQANKRIRYRIDANSLKHIDDTNGAFNRFEFDKEKFAELIVRECMNLTRNCYDSHTSEYADKIISNHFDIDN